MEVSTKYFLMISINLFSVSFSSSSENFLIFVRVESPLLDMVGIVKMFSIEALYANSSLGVIRKQPLIS